MQRVLPASHSLPLFGIESTREIEQQASAALPPHSLMRRAGLAIARLGLAVAPHASRVWVVAGPGNNGGDGLDAAIHLQAAGKAVTVTLLGDPAQLPADAHDALLRAQAAGVAIGTDACLDAPDLVLDALLGAGATRSLQGTLAACIKQMNTLTCPVLGVDLPSGLHASSGRLLGDDAVRATHTLSLLTLKPGLFTAAGRDHAGEVWLDELGVTDRQVVPDAWLVGADLLAAPVRRHVQHKGSFGDVAVVGGARGMVGAALLAAGAAHAAGAGRVYVGMLDDAAPTHDPARPELMFRQRWWTADDTVLNRSTVVCGCGGSDAVREPLPRLLSGAGRLVLDADALNAIAADSMLQTLLRQRAARGRPTVLTPHPLEAARLLSCAVDEVQADRLTAAQSLAERFGCVALLKGSGSVVAAPGETPRINPTGSAALASAGTGDVLAGWLAGLWAQRTPPATMADAQDVACCAAFAHGAAADACGAFVMRAGDLIERLALRR